MSLKLIKAEKQDLKTITNLLQENNLPYQDIETDNKEFFLVYNDSLLIGIIGLEKFDNIGLLRSLAVKDNYKNKGYGTKICIAFMDYAKNEQINDLYLLTCTAKEFFEKIGFEVIERDSVPDVIKRTTEFSSLCPASAKCLVKTIQLKIQ